MRKRLVRVTSAALLLASLATPAFAHGNEKEKENKGNGWAFGHVIAKLNKDMKFWKEAKREVLQVANACLQDAREAHADAVEAARDANDATLRGARNAYRDALDTAGAAQRLALRNARKVRREAMASARATLIASDKGEVAIAAYVTAKTKADADHDAAKKAAQEAYRAAKAAAETPWKAAKAAADVTFSAAKAKADADLIAAKAKCAATTPAPAPVPTPVADTYAPGATTVSLSSITSSSVVVSWIAPGDDAAVGTASAYDLRYSTSAIVTAADFNAAIPVVGEPAPAVAGTTQSMTVSGLSANTAYWFALKTQDEVPNVSVQSNVATATTLAP